MGVITAAAVTTLGMILARIIGNKVDRVYEQVTPNRGKSAHDKLVEKIEDERHERRRALDEHERRLHQEG